VLFEKAKLLTKSLGEAVENIQCYLAVHPKFCQPMPMGEVKQKLKYLAIMGFWKEALKNWDYSLSS
jgi:hypothetical protein